MKRPVQILEKLLEKYYRYRESRHCEELFNNVEICIEIIGERRGERTLIDREHVNGREIILNYNEQIYTLNISVRHGEEKESRIITVRTLVASAPVRLEGDRIIDVESNGEHIIISLCDDFDSAVLSIVHSLLLKCKDIEVKLKYYENLINTITDLVYGEIVKKINNNIIDRSIKIGDMVIRFIFTCDGDRIHLTVFADGRAIYDEDSVDNLRDMIHRAVHRLFTSYYVDDLVSILSVLDRVMSIEYVSNRSRRLLRTLSRICSSIISMFSGKI